MQLFDALVPRNPEEDPLRSVSAHGSFAYLDPNYADTKTLSAASDVYSFGVLLLEVISGRPAMEEDSATLIVMVSTILPHCPSLSLIASQCHCTHRDFVDPALEGGGMTQVLLSRASLASLWLASGAGVGCGGEQAQDYFILREDYPKLLDPALGVEGAEGEQAGPGSGGVPRHELVAMVELVQTCTQVKEESRPSMTWVKAQMMAALRMGPEEYSEPSVAHDQGPPHGAGASEIEIEMMSEGSPGMPHSSD